MLIMLCSEGQLAGTDQSFPESSACLSSFFLALLELERHCSETRLVNTQRSVGPSSPLTFAEENIQDHFSNTAFYLDAVTSTHICE